MFRGAYREAAGSACRSTRSEDARPEVAEWACPSKRSEDAAASVRAQPVPREPRPPEVLSEQPGLRDLPESVPALQLPAPPELHGADPRCPKRKSRAWVQLASAQEPVQVQAQLRAPVSERQERHQRPERRQLEFPPRQVQYRRARLQPRPQQVRRLSSSLRPSSPELSWQQSSSLLLFWPELLVPRAEHRAQGLHVLPYGELGRLVLRRRSKSGSSRRSRARRTDPRSPYW